MRYISLIFLMMTLLVGGCGGSKGEAGNIIHNVVLSWDAPTLNIDGTPCTDLAGYKVYVGTSSRNYSQVYDTGTLDTTFTLQLTDGYYCFAVTAYDTSGNESDYSNEVCQEFYTVVPDTTPPSPPILKSVTEQ